MHHQSDKETIKNLVEVLEGTLKILGKHVANKEKLCHGQDEYSSEIKHAWLMVNDALLTHKRYQQVNNWLAKQSILVIDDESDLGRSLAHRLNRRGIRTAFLHANQENGKQILDSLRSQEYTLVLADYSGHPIETWAKASSCPLVLWTNATNPIPKGQAGCLSKRASVRTIVEVINKYSSCRI